MARVPISMNANNRYRTNPLRQQALHRASGCCQIQRFDLFALPRKSPLKLNRFFVNLFRQHNMKIEEPWSLLRSDPKDVGKSAIYQKRRARSLAFKQSVGNYGSSHLD